jgi:ribosome-interacting GTPase 1
MPANLTPQYFKAEERYKAATDDRERMAALREMLSIMPKHKGTEKLQAELKSKIKKLKDTKSSKSKASRGPSLHIERSGAGQVVLVGPPNGGKSSLIRALTPVEAEVADYPGSTRTPLPAMMPYKDIAVQLVDAPPVHEDYMESWYPDLIRGSDMVLLVFGLASDDILEEVEIVRAALEKCRVLLEPEAGPREDWPVGVKVVRAWAVGNACEVEGAQERRDLAAEMLGDALPLQRVSTVTGEGIEPLRQRIVEVLDVIRVYTRQPGAKKSDLGEPFTLPHGTTVIEAAARVHKDIAAALKTAKVWGSAKFDGAPVQRDHVLEDGDIVEFHT